MADSADRSPSRKPEIISGGTAESPILVDETEADKKRSSPSSTSSDQTTSSGTGLGKTPGTGSRSNHGETRKELVAEDKPSEAKEEAEKRRRESAKETRDKGDRDNLKLNAGSSQNEKKDKKTKKKSSRSHLVYGCRVSSSPFLRSSSRSWSFLLFDNSIQVSLLLSNFPCLSDGDNFV
jgi:hypothetical protein